MNFRTVIDIDRWQHTIDYSHSIVSLGSCFANNIATKLAENKFRVVASPTGILFNPASIAAAVERMLDRRMVVPDELIYSDGRYVSYDLHSAFGGDTRESAAVTINEAIERGYTALRDADHLIITLGTAWVYRLVSSGEVVANCHKQPHAAFRREMLSTDEVVRAMEGVISRFSADKRITLTLSPVRHLGDGLADNSLSKATLRVAINTLCHRYPNVDYFPSYEILLDDLRDYRFYAEDMIHPSTMAVEYIAERFFDVALSPRAKELMPAVRQVVRGANHRPSNPQSREYIEFCRKQLAAIERLPEVDFSEEKRLFEHILQINL